MSALFTQICYGEIMRTFAVYFMFIFLMSGCSEEKKQSKEIKEENQYLKKSIVEKLGNIDQIHMEEKINKLSKGEIDDLSFLMMFYMHTGTSMIMCDAMSKVYLETDPAKKKLGTKQSETECGIYQEIYEKYNPMYLKIVNTNLIPVYYYFDLQKYGNENNSSIGIFPTKNECEDYSNLFRTQKIGLTSNCKKGFSSN